MNRLLSFLFAAGFLATTFAGAVLAAQPKEPELGEAPPPELGSIRAVLNTGGHTNLPVNLAFSPDGKKLVSIDSFEVHVWNTASGQRERTWRLPTPLHRGGSHFANSDAPVHYSFWNYITTVAVAPDNKTVAVAATGSRVWLLDLLTGDSRRVNLPDSPWIDYLSFSPNSRRLAWSSHQLAGVLDLGPLPSPPGGRGQGEGDRVSHVLRVVPEGQPVEKRPKNQNFSRVSFGKDSNQLFAHGAVYDLTVPAGPKEPFQLTKPLFSLSRPDDVVKKGFVPDLCWSPDGSQFVDISDAAAVAGSRSAIGPLRFWTGSGHLEKKAVSSHRKVNQSSRLDFLTDGRVAIASFEAVTEYTTGKPTLKSVVQMRIVNPRTGKMELPERWPAPANSGSFGIYYRLAIAPAGNFIATIVKDSSIGYQVVLFDVAGKKPPRTLGTSFPIPSLLVFGHDSRSIGWGGAWGETPNIKYQLDDNKSNEPGPKDKKGPPPIPKKDEFGKSFVSGGFDLRSLELLKKPQVEGYGVKLAIPDGWSFKSGVLYHGDTRMPVAAGGSAFFKDAEGKVGLARPSNGNLELIEPETGKTLAVLTRPIQAVAGSPDFRFLVTRRWDYGWGSLAFDIYRLDQSPGLLMQVFVAGQDWIAWTPEGYYAATPGCEKMMGWASKKDDYHALTFYPAERFRKQLYRPDVIKLLLDKGNIKEALAAANAELKKDGIVTPAAADVVAELSKLLPPVATLQILDKTALPKVTVKASAIAAVANQPVTALRLLVDGRPLTDGAALQTFDGGKKEAAAEWSITLPPGKHQLAVLARCPDSSSISNMVEIEVADPTKQNTLHVLAVGVNDYEDGTLKLDFAAKDARDIAAGFQKSSKGTLFHDVHSEALVNGKARKEAILSRLSALRKEAKPNDLVVIFFAGHGVKEKDKFYLLPVEAKTTDLAKTAISGDELRKSLGEFPCQVLLMLDACHSSGSLKNFRPAVDDITRTLTDDDCGVAVLCAAMAHEKALEKEGNGLFTKAIVDGLNRGDGVPFNTFDRMMYVHHLHSFVFDRVSHQSGGRQHPFLSLPWVVESFPVARFASK